LEFFDAIVGVGGLGCRMAFTKQGCQEFESFLHTLIVTFCYRNLEFYHTSLEEPHELLLSSTQIIYMHPLLTRSVLRLHVTFYNVMCWALTNGVLSRRRRVLLLNDMEPIVKYIGFALLDSAKCFLDFGMERQCFEIPIGQLPSHGLQPQRSKVCMRLS